MLLTDGDPNDTIALTVYESAILNVANVETIDLDIKLTLATEEISEDVLDILLDHTRTVDPLTNARRILGVSDVVVTTQMKRWHALHTLAIVYRDAFNNQLNDRYQAKLAEYQELARNARTHTIQNGIGLSLNPVPQAQQPALSAVSGTGQAATYYVQTSWVSAMGQEGTPSLVTALGTAAGQDLVVEPLNPPQVATGFNVYIGATATTLALQNSPAIAIGNSFTLAGALAAGAAPGTGQTPDIYVVGGPMLRRG
jgi:hypothetical protein